MTEELQKEMDELKALGYRIKGKGIKYIYNHNEVVGKKITFEIEKKELTIFEY